MNSSVVELYGPRTASPQSDGGLSEAGLSEAEAARRLVQHGPNEVSERRSPVWRRVAGHFWGPLPWMLEVTVLLTVALGKDLEGAIIAVLLMVNGVIAFAHQEKADEALRLLRRRLQVEARVRRDGRWRRVRARELVPGDVVCIRVGDLVPADLELLDGHVSLDQSALTGESLPVDASVGAVAPGSSVVTRGEATAVVSATGASSFIGQASALTAQSSPVTHLEGIIFQIVRYLMMIDVALVAVLLVFARATGVSLSAAAPFALIILIASVPVALPTTFTVAQTIAATELSQGIDDDFPGHRVLVTRLAAVQEAASLDVLCTDKTGTLTRNHLRVADTVAYPPVDRPRLLEWAAEASDESGQDPIDLALRRSITPDGRHGPLRGHPVAAGKGADPARPRVGFLPFDPSTKRTEALVEQSGMIARVVKGMPAVVAELCARVPAAFDDDLERLAASGARVLAVASGPVGGPLSLAGLVALADTPRTDSAELISELARAGIAVKMVTGDSAATAAAVARQVGIEPTVCRGSELRRDPQLAERCSVFAEVHPADKHALVTVLQANGHVVGMTGDGVNDAPALKQAGVGIAVDGAVDVAKAAASMVLTEPGLVGMLAVVTASRRIYQRMMTWTLNKVVKTAQVAVFLTLAFLVTRHFVTTPLLVVLLLLANDFVTMSLAADHAQPAAGPQRWRVGPLVVAGFALAGVVLAESFLVLWLARVVFALTWPQTQTLVFAMLVFSGQATVYVVRERDRFWRSRPVKWMSLATTVDVVVVGGMAFRGVLMTSVGLVPLLVVLGVAAGFMFVMDPFKVIALRRLERPVGRWPVS